MSSCNSPVNENQSKDSEHTHTHTALSSILSSPNPNLYCTSSCPTLTSDQFQIISLRSSGSQTLIFATFGPVFGPHTNRRTRSNLIFKQQTLRLEGDGCVCSSVWIKKQYSVNDLSWVFWWDPSGFYVFQLVLKSTYSQTLPWHLGIELILGLQLEFF